MNAPDVSLELRAVYTICLRELCCLWGEDSHHTRHYLKENAETRLLQLVSIADIP